MARPGLALLDWHLFFRAVCTAGARPVRSRFAVELAPDLIVSPHLFDWERSGPYEPDTYTCSKTPLLMVFCGRGEHLAFLRDELIPAVIHHSQHVVLIDADRRQFAVDGEDTWRPLDRLGPILRAGYGLTAATSEDDSIDHLIEQLSGNVDEFERRLLVQDEVAPGQAERIEQHPIRLWEALFWRGHSYRYELLQGEVPLVGNLLTPRGANRTLMQLLEDARSLEGCSPSDERGWIRCGRFRMRQKDQAVHIRVRLDPADVRAAFMPRARIDGDDVLPSLLGALMAGGDNGKTELMDGWTWSTVITASAEMASALAPKLQREIQQWVGAPASVTSPSFEFPKEPRDEWFVAAHERYVTIYVPFHREHCLPWDVHAEEYSHPIAELPR